MKRILAPDRLLEKSSCFLFGPRGTGKSYLLRQLDPGRFDYIDLLRSRIYLDLQRDPDQLDTLITHKVVIIDEIQRIPELLNAAHRLIEENGIRFILTGSSARKLRKGGVNLLAGRAYKASLFGLSWSEISKEQSFDLDRYLLYGGLPSSYLGDDPTEYLYAYTDTYLREEIMAEAFVKKLANYDRFLHATAMSNAEMVNFTKIGNDAQLSPNTVRDYFGLLQDTLLGQMLPPWTLSRKRKAIQTAKFYFFDIGVVHSLKNITTIERNTDSWGKAFEHFIYCEIRSCLAYARCRKPLSYWRSKSNFEVDFIIGDDIAIEVKASARVTERDHKGLKALKEEKEWRKLLVVSNDKTYKRFSSGIEHLYWEVFLKRLWEGSYF
jgi:predicted AAA+ superfamily ATPase